MKRLSLRTLPPVGGRIPFHTVYTACRESLIAGSGESQLKAELIKLTGLQHWVLTNSGRSALSVMLKALASSRPDCDEVIIPAFTSYSVPAAVVRAGLRVRLCDVEVETLGLSPKDLERELTPKTLCVVPNHLYGYPCRIEAIKEISRAHKVPMLEDAAQALGSRCNGRQVGTFGEVVIYSLSRGKTLPAAGGGLLGTNNEKLSRECRQILENNSGTSKARIGIRAAIETTLMATFIHPSLYWLPVQLPFLKLGASIYDPSFTFSPMSLFQEALGKALLSHLPMTQAARKNTATRLRRALDEVNKDNSFFVVWPKEGVEGAFLRLPILFKTRDARNYVLMELNQLGLGASSAYPTPLSEILALRSHLVHPEEEYPVSKLICDHLLTLPTHLWVTDKDIEEMARTVSRCI